MPISYMRKKAAKDPRDQKLPRKRLLTDLSTMPFVVPEDEYGMPRPAIHVVPHPLTPEFMPPPPQGRVRSALQLRGWRGIGLAVVTAAGLALVALELLPAIDEELPIPAVTGIRARVSASPPAIEAATKIAEGFERLDAGPAAGAEPQPEAGRGTDVMLNRLLEWDRKAATTPAQ